MRSMPQIAYSYSSGIVICVFKESTRNLPIVPSKIGFQSSKCFAMWRVKTECLQTAAIWNISTMGA
jgi:hypothetical protein